MCISFLSACMSVMVLDFLELKLQTVAMWVLGVEPSLLESSQCLYRWAISLGTSHFVLRNISPYWIYQAFILKGCWVLSKAFSTSIKRTTLFCPSFYQCNIQQLFTCVHWAIPPLQRYIPLWVIGNVHGLLNNVLLKIFAFVLILVYNYSSRVLIWLQYKGNTGLMFKEVFSPLEFLEKFGQDWYDRSLNIW